MDKDNQNETNIKSPKKRYKFRKSTKKNSKIIRKKAKKLELDSDSEDSDYIPDEDIAIILEEEHEEDSQEEEEEKKEDEDSEEEEESEEDETEHEDMEDEKDDFDAREFQKFVQKIFPSKSGKERLKQLEKIDKIMEKDEAKKKNKKISPKKTNSKKIKNKKITKKTNKKVNKKNKKKPVDDESTDEEYERKLDEALRKEEAEILAKELEDKDDLDDEELQEMMRQNTKFNIVFTIGQPEDFEDETSEEEDAEEAKEEKDNKKIYKNLKKNQKVKVKHRTWDKYHTGKIKSVIELSENPAYSTYDIKLDDDENGEEWNIQKNIKGKYIKAIGKEELDDDDILKELESLIKTRKGKGKKAMLKQFDRISKAQERTQTKKEKEKEERQKGKNVSTLRKLLRAPNIMNDFKYFKTMELDNQKKVIAQLKEVNKYSKVEKPYRLQLLDSEIPIAYKSTALKKINTLNYMDPGSGEYYKIKQWVDTFMTIPFGKTKQLPISMDDGLEKCNSFMENAKKQLDECVYGLDDAKMQILQLVGQWLSNPNSIGTAIAIKGPPGTGKTTLIKEGISKILQRPFAFLALGGATDSSFLEGHSYTYEGSSWGKIVDILIQSKCMNPVFYFDELDKISDTPKGEEITGILTHLTDTTQNTSFHDKYFSNMDFNLSKSLFIFSYNDESKVNPILKDRMYRIHTDGYDTKKKLVIAKKYLIPKIEKNVNFKEGEIIINDDALTKIIDTFTDSEKGVRNLKRCLEIIYTKLNLYRLMKKDSSLFENEKAIHVTFPFTVSLEILDKIIKKGEKSGPPLGMYI